MRSQEHPLVVSRDGAAGRRARLVGGPDVWEVARAVRSARAAEPDLRERSDAELIGHALATDRTLVTNNVSDFEGLRRHRTGAGETVPLLIYTSDAAFPRDRRFVGRLIAALDRARANGVATATGGVIWLRPVHQPPH